MDTKVDCTVWPRREIFSFMSGMSNPYYAVTFRQDVTPVYYYAKRHSISFYYTMVGLCTKAINEVEAFRYVIRAGEVWRLGEDRVPSFTDLKPGGDCFYIVTMPMEGTLQEFARAARQRSTEQTVFLDMTTQTDGLIYFSCLPWLDVTGLTNERDLAQTDARDESIPRIAWGKYVPVGDRLELGISFETNHRLIDGVHIGQFGAALDRLIQELEREEDAK